MSAPRLKGLLFDKDGTLFDYQKSWGGFTLGFIDGLAEGDTALARRLAEAMGVDPETAQFSPESPIVAGTPEEAIAPVLPLLRGWNRAALTDRINTAAAAAPQVPATDLTALFDTLRGRGHVLGIATNDAEAAAHAHLIAAGVAEHFAYVAGYDSGHGAKPGPGMCLAFADAQGLAPEHCVMIGDSTHDLEAGRAAGMVCVAVCTGITPPEVLAPHAAVVLPHIGHLPEWLATA
ncbi:HAD family hydrolase [Vannielia litorea]|uniref:HAD family hydrolase n=1 Tax=Vannielia litorea TaxID=1217970 RepID=UPI001C94AC96|nr:HAD family hydrolase [Vannielia litorea]MBY6047791.1 HAD family hydrolase [Vannielia litorea]MBY6075205.1 HAD family hydrolase [Vannielia litorea]